MSSEASSPGTVDAPERQSIPTPQPMPLAIPAEIDLDSPELLLNRELTWLAFNRRVLHEAEDERNPLLERVKFLAIANGTLDEFVMKRLGGLKQQVAAGVQTVTPDGRTPRQQIAECYAVMRGLKERSQKLLGELRAALLEAGIKLCTWSDLSTDQQAHLRDHYLHNVFPLVTPQAMDPAHPFPFVSNLSLNILVTLRRSDSDPDSQIGRAHV